MRYSVCSFCGAKVLDLVSHQKTHDKAREFLYSGKLPKGWERAA